MSFFFDRVMLRPMRRLRLLVLGLGVLTCGFGASSVNAGLIGSLLGSNCSNASTQAYAAWGDARSYYLAPDGGFESGSTGWTLGGGAAVVTGNEPFLATGTHSLSLPSGSDATSPVVCIGPQDLVIRMFAADSGGTDSGLRVRVLWYGLLNKLLGASDVTVFAPGGPWAPTATVSSQGGVNVLLPLLGSTSARVEVTPLGAGSAWHIDDLYVDPYRSG
jgi:hypothetical protein